MKIRKYCLPILFIFYMSELFFISCSESEHEVKNNPELQVTKTQTNIDYKGGTVVIQTNMDGVEAHSRDSWLKTEISGSQVCLTASLNPSYESRTTIVLITYGKEVQQVPVTQLGVISIVNIYSCDFPEKGGSKAFLWKTDQEYQITGVDSSWLSYEIKGDSIYFKSTALGVYDDTRSCTINITSGSYYNKEVVFNQIAPELSYEQLLGNYTLEYTRWSDTKIFRTDVRLVEKETGKTFILKGLTLDITVLFNSKGPGIAIKSQFLKNKDAQDVWLAAWEGQGKGHLRSDSRFGVISQWNGNKKEIEFTMVPDGVIDNTWKDDVGNPIITRGFILWGNNEYTSGGESRFVNMKFIKRAN